MGRRMFIRHRHRRKKLEPILVGLGQTTVGSGAQDEHGSVIR